MRHGNPVDRSGGVARTRWWGLRIHALAQVAEEEETPSPHIGGGGTDIRKGRGVIALGGAALYWSSRMPSSARRADNCLRQTLVGRDTVTLIHDEISIGCEGTGFETSGGFTEGVDTGSGGTDGPPRHPDLLAVAAAA